MKKRFLIILALISLLLLAFNLTSSAQQPRYGGTLNVGVADNPPTLDWPFTTANATRHVSKYIWEGLVVFDANDQLKPMLAKDWEVSEDKLTWTFHLLEGVYFHNGKEMTSEDAAASLRRWVEISPYKGSLTVVKSVNEIDKYTFEIKLEEKMGSLAALMAMRSGHAVVMPKEVCEGVAGGKLEQYIGTGPYKFGEWKLDQYIKLLRFDDYHNAYAGVEPNGYAGEKNAYLDEIIVNIVPETSTLLAGLETGEFDIIEPIQPMEVPRLEEIKEIKLQRYPKWSLTTFFNTKVGFFQDIRLRQAAQMALDMEEIMLSVGKKPENIELVSSMFREDSAWYTGALEKYYNLKDTEGAKKLMAEAGYKGEELIMMTTKHYPWAFDMAIAIVDQLSKIGFNFKMEVVDWPTLVARRDEPVGWDLFTTATGPVTDPVMMNQWFTGSYPGWYVNPGITKQMEIISQEDIFEKRFEALAKLEDLLGENPNAIRPGFTFEYRGYRSNIKGLPEFVEGIFSNVYKE